MPQTPRQLSMLFCLLLLGFLYAYQLQNVGMTNWDAVSNYERVQAMADGNFQALFHHGSPTFFLLFTPIAYFFEGFLPLEFANILLMLVAICLLMRLLAKNFNFSILEESLCLLFVGSSLLIIDVARSFSIEALTLLIFALATKSFLQFSANKNSKNWIQTWFWLGFLMTVNYKAVLILPVFFGVASLGLNDKKTINNIHVNQEKHDFKIPILAFSSIFSIYILLGKILGLPLIIYPKTLAALFLRGKVQGGIFHTDIDYYLQYLQFYENPLLLIVFVFFVWLNRKNLQNPFNKFMIGGFIFTLILMSFLAKAPRGLLFVLPMLYAMCFSAMVLFKGFQGKMKLIFTVVLSSLLIGYNIYLAQRNIFNYTSTNYPSLVNYLKINHIQKILLTNGKGIIPFLDKTTQTKLIANEQEIDQFKKQGYTHCLIDDYCQIAQLDSFVTLRQQKPIWQAPEPTLEAPLIYLDHSEFTGLSFNETLYLREKVRKDSIHLRLVKL